MMALEAWVAARAAWMPSSPAQKDHTLPAVAARVAQQAVVELATAATFAQVAVELVVAAMAVQPEVLAVAVLVQVEDFAPLLVSHRL